MEKSKYCNQSGAELFLKFHVVEKNVLNHNFMTFTETNMAIDRNDVKN